MIQSKPDINKNLSYILRNCTCTIINFVSNKC